MTQLSLLPALLLASLLAACGAPFTASDLSGLGEAGEAPQGTAGASGAAPGSAGQAGAPSTAGASGTSEGGFGGGVVPIPTAGAAGTSAGGSGGAPVLAEPPCAHATDTVSPGYLALGGPGCYRTKETFDTIYCLGTGWTERTIKVNGALAECNKTQAFAPRVDGYNYFELLGPGGASDTLRWLTAGDSMACWQSIEQSMNQCADFVQGDALSYAGKNYICSKASCNCTDPAYLPGGSAGAWTDLGACGQ